MNTQNAKTEEAVSAQVSSPNEKLLRHRIVIVGGGSAGLTATAQLTKGVAGEKDVVILYPSSNHYYQPAWTLVGGGASSLESTRRDEAKVIPPKAKWIQDAVTGFSPEKNQIHTRDGRTIQYDYLIVGAGIQINWDQVKGLKEAVGTGGVCSNYSFETVASTWDAIRNFQGGTAIFTQPSGPVKCGGAPQKVCHLAEDYFRKHGIRDKCRVIFATAGSRIFSVEKYRKVLE